MSSLFLALRSHLQKKKGPSMETGGELRSTRTYGDVKLVGGLAEAARDCQVSEVYRILV